MTPMSLLTLTSEELVAKERGNFHRQHRPTGVVVLVETAPTHRKTPLNLSHKSGERACVNMKITENCRNEDEFSNYATHLENTLEGLLQTMPTEA